MVTEPREHVSASLHIGYQLLMHMYWKLETFKLHDCEFYARICVHVRTYVHVHVCAATGKIYEGTHSIHLHVPVHEHCKLRTVFLN